MKLTGDDVDAEKWPAIQKGILLTKGLNRTFGYCFGSIFPKKFRPRKRSAYLPTLYLHSE